MHIEESLKINRIRIYGTLKSEYSNRFVRKKKNLNKKRFTEILWYYKEELNFF